MNLTKKFNIFYERNYLGRIGNKTRLLADCGSRLEVGDIVTLEIKGIFSDKRNSIVLEGRENSFILGLEDECKDDSNEYKKYNISLLKRGGKLVNEPCILVMGKKLDIIPVKEKR